MRELYSLLALVILLPFLFRSPAEQPVPPPQVAEAPTTAAQAALEPESPLVEIAALPTVELEEPPLLVAVEDAEPTVFIPTMRVEVAALPPLPQEEIDANFLFLRYQMTDKVDSTGDFAWKDIAAAERAKMPLQQFVVGGLNKKFTRTMANLLRGALAAGFDPGVTSCFRDNYRQALITRGTRSVSHLSFHGGSARGGYGHGKACDVVHIAKNAKERHALNLKLWVWIETHGHEYGVGLPYGRFDGGHVAPLNGAEYAAKYNARRSWTKYVAALLSGPRKAMAKHTATKKKKKRVQVASAK